MLVPGTHIDAGGMELRPLTDNDIPAAMRLKERAGWNQTEGDWRRLLLLEPGGCFAAWSGGRLVGTTSTTRYESELAWVGMVLVAPEFRRRGIATLMVGAALEHLGRAGVATVKLDATPDGRKVYESVGFEAELLVERWCGVAGGGIESPAVALDASSLPELLAYDRRAFGADRSALLKGLIDDSCATPLASVGPDGGLGGYALARRGTAAFYLGPLVAEDGASAAALLDGMLGRLAGGRVYIDLNTTFTAGAQELAARGFVKQRDLLRMRRGGRTGAGTSDSVFAIAGPEVG